MDLLYHLLYLLRRPSLHCLRRAGCCRVPPTSCMQVHGDRRAGRTFIPYPPPPPACRYKEALAAVFVEGWIFILISVTGVRGRVVELIPKHILYSTAVGIGRFRFRGGGGPGCAVVSMAGGRCVAGG